MAYYQYAECGAYGHAWFRYDSQHWSSIFGGTKVTLRCERCESERREIWAPMSGSLINRYYDYPLGYSFKGEARPSRDDFRAMLISELSKPKRLDRRRRQRPAAEPLLRAADGKVLKSVK